VSGVIQNPIQSDLVVELFTPDGTGPEQNSLYVGANGNGETRPSYIAATDCGLPEPTPLDSVGFPYVHLILVVNGELTGGSTPSEITTWGGLKALYK
jgi:hypothetical protein